MFPLRRTKIGTGRLFANLATVLRSAGLPGPTCRRFLFILDTTIGLVTG